MITIDRLAITTNNSGTWNLFCSTCNEVVWGAKYALAVICKDKIVGVIPDDSVFYQCRECKTDHKGPLMSDDKDQLRIIFRILTATKYPIKVMMMDSSGKVNTDSKILEFSEVE